MKSIICEVGLSDYFDFIDCYFLDDYEVIIDFNFEISENKKRYISFI